MQNVHAHEKRKIQTDVEHDNFGVPCSDYRGTICMVDHIDLTPTTGIAYICACDMCCYRLRDIV